MSKFKVQEIFTGISYSFISGGENQACDLHNFFSLKKNGGKKDTFAAASEAAAPCLKRDHGARSSMYKFPALPISSTASQADDNERFSY